MNRIKVIALLGLGVLLVSCQSLDTENLTNPDAERALSEPGDVESLIGSQFYVWMDNSYGSYPSWALSVAADEGTGSWGNQGMQVIGSEPRVAFPNTPAWSYNNVTETPWYGMYRALSSANDGLVAVKDGMEFGTDGEDTKRAEVFARFVQGLATGWLALQFDQAFIYTEDVDLNTEKLELKPYTEVMNAAIKMLDDAAAGAAANAFTLPNNWINEQTINSQELARIAKSFSARFLASVARTPEERAAVNWADVLARINAGITRDFGFQADNTNWEDEYKERLQNSGWIRADYRTVGPADISGGYQQWLATPVDDRQPFDITTPDQRVTGATPASDGTDFYYRLPQDFRADRGTYHFSRYGHKRYASIRQTQIGFVPLMTLTEMDLYKAEAHIRLNQPDAAATLVNKTRVARGKLPPVAATGTAGADCVPRTTTGTCGDLMAALMYEKRIEAFAVASGGAFFDARGWGILVPGTQLHFPVPARELETLGLLNYSFGGSGPFTAK
ncbi:MAG: RagB/SusD family nutrient uptake outer membrane protein [Gemmatimonadota bacterium]